MGPFVGRPLTAAAACALLMTAATSARGDEPLPYRIDVAVVAGADRAPDTARAALEQALRARLAAERCFAELGPPSDPPTPRELRLRLTVADFEEQTRYETGLAPPSGDRPPEMRQVVTEISASLTLELSTAAESLLVRRERWREHGSTRALLSEDPSAAARARWLHDAVKRAAKRACKGSARAWQRAIEETRAAADAAR